jgi:hypothetical protein
MNIRRVLLAAACTAGLSGFGAGVANASTVLYDDSGFLQGQQSFTKSFDLSGPGTLTVTLSNITWPEKLASLNMLLSTANGLVGPEMGEGTAQYEVTGGRVFAQWFGKAQGPLNLGVYGMKIEFTPGVAAVPLPASLTLFLSGLALFVWQRRTQRDGDGDGDGIGSIHPV